MTNDVYPSKDHLRLQVSWISADISEVNIYCTRDVKSSRKSFHTRQLTWPSIINWVCSNKKWQKTAMSWFHLFEWCFINFCPWAVHYCQTMCGNDSVVTGWYTLKHKNNSGTYFSWTNWTFRLTNYVPLFHSLLWPILNLVILLMSFPKIYYLSVMHIPSNEFLELWY